MSERRAHPRLDVSMDVTWECAGVEVAGRVFDIGLAGCFLEGGTQPVLGQVLTLALRFHHATPLRLQAWVVYTHPGQGFGVRFVNVDEFSRARLAKQLTSLGLANAWGAERRAR